MKAHELAKKLLECPDFEVEFSGMIKYWNEEYSCEDSSYVKFISIDIADIGHSDKVIIITGDEV